MPWARLPLRAVVAVGAVLGVLGVLSAAPASAAGASAAKDARRIYDEATAAFGLGHYAEAAEKYEAAFAIRPDPALLYNAAQAYRLGGNKPRAMELYRNYVRLYPDGTNAVDARTHADALKKAIDSEPPKPPPAAKPPVTALPSAASPPAASSAPPAAGAPARAMPAPVETTVPSAPPAAPAPAGGENVPNVPMVSRPASATDEPPLTKQTWFWVAAGAGAVLVGAMVILAISGGGVTYPDPTYGRAVGN